MRKLIRPVIVKTDKGGEAEKEPVYKDSECASQLVKDVVKNDDFPIAKDDKYLYRTDLDSGDFQ